MGVVGTLVHYSILYALVEFEAFNPVIASGWGALAGLAVNYVLNFKLTFNSSQPHTQTLPKFTLIALIGMGINLALMQILVPRLFYLYAQLMATALVLLWNFFANLFWTFAIDQPRLKRNADLGFSIRTPHPSLALIFLILFIRIATLGLYPLYDPSESRYAEMARKMLETQNWVTPMIDYGVPFWGKPPLTIWLTSLSMEIVGVNDFAARLPSVFLSIGIAWVLFHLAHLQRSVDYARSTLLVLASSVLFFVMSGTVAMDQCMTFGVTLALSGFWLALRHRESLWGYVFFVGLGIGMMAKGPITIVISGLTIGMWTAITGRWNEIWHRIPWIKGTLIMLVISAPWYWLAEQRTPGFWEYFFIGEHWKRFTESGWKGDLYGVGREHARGMIWLYWLAAGFPWTLVLLKKLINTMPGKATKTFFQDSDGWQLYCLLWMLSPVLFFTLSANVIWTYVLPGLPGLALLVAGWVEQSKKYRAALTMCVPVSFFALVLIYQLPDVEFYKSQKHIADAFLRESGPDEQLIYISERPFSAQFYLPGKTLELTNFDALQQSLRQANRHFYVLNQQLFDMLSDAMKQQLKPVKIAGRYTLFETVSAN
ncbi:phospholipid carrier-dependent glycosyltransferase [Methylomonas albis]|uniref:Phospholipid carrier-dependent glycosyltransferase n=1 Tax=Methylomonas albis TaxID=1854563 RepID=A0ABR9D6K1_9GAMM|nr:phospholipid carrier-dependent glycosyltransferase [Methylomonas albis]MBD9358744.1 phospholipid carrier-dependent glycosyltransferase [Methylomonas albis]